MKKMKKLWMLLLSLAVFFCCVQAAPLEAAAVNDYTQWKQYDAEWNQQEAWPASQYPAATMRWMRQAGCVVTSVAMLVRHYGVVADGNVNAFNPWICNERLKQAGAFTSAADLYWGKVANAFPGMTYQNTVSYSAEKLSSLFNQGYACMVKVAGRSHYVAIRDAKSAGNIVTMDPGSSSTSLNTYGGGAQIIYFKTSGRPGSGIQDTTPPVISNITVEKDRQGYTVRCKVTDDTGLSRVIFPTWTLNNGQDDLVPDWTVNPSVEGTISGSTVTYRVNISNHFYEYGTYITDIYAFDNNGNASSDRVGIDMDTEKDVPAERISMYRLYNPNSGEHFYTGLVKEKNFLSKSGWKYEGVSWTAPSTSKTPVYRLYNPNGGDHHYTTSRNERDFLIQAGWKDEGTGWYSEKNNGVPLYRLYNPNARTGSHHYTTEIRERDFLRQNGWNYEGIAWYGMN